MRICKQTIIKCLVALAVIGIFSVMPAVAGGGSYCKTLTADGVASNVTCKVTGVYVARDTSGGGNAVTVQLYDNASAASGTRLFPPIQISGSSTSPIDGATLPEVIAENGVYVDITASGSTVVTVCMQRR